MTHDNEKCYVLFTFNGYSMCTDFPLAQINKSHEHLCGLSLLPEVRIKGVVTKRNLAERWEFGRKTKENYLFVR